MIVSKHGTTTYYLALEIKVPYLYQVQVVLGTPDIGYSSSEPYLRIHYLPTVIYVQVYKVSRIY
eukprot:SAG11_NODE_1187_length_5588_cov_6.285662_6_plen_64_part_00